MDSDLDQEKEEKVLALFKAVDQGNIQEVEEALDLLRGVNINEDSSDFDGAYTPLKLAIKQRKYAVARKLLENGASAKAVDSDKYSQPPMHEATLTGSIEMVKLLIEFGAGVDDLDYSQLSPLILACRRGDLDMIRFLFDQGVNVDHMSTYEPMPLWLRMHFDYSTEEFVDRRCEPWRFDTPLIEACRFRHLEVVKELLARGANTEVAHPQEMTALMVASSCRTPETYGFKDFDDRAKFNIMPTWPPILRHLIQNGASVTAVNRFDETAVHCVLRDIITASRHEQKSPYVAKTLQYYYINFCLLAKAGCSVLPSYEIDLDTAPHLEDKQSLKTLGILTEAYRALREASPDTHLDTAYLSAMKSAVLSGLKVDKADLSAVENLPDLGTKEDTLTFLNDVLTEGCSLRHLCQIRLRDMARRPLFPNIMSGEFQLPVFLKQCILLDRDVPTDAWFEENSGLFNDEYPNYTGVRVLGRIP